MSTSLRSQLAPKGLSFNPSDFFISDKYATILTVVSYPKYITPGYLSSLTNMPGIKVVVTPGMIELGDKEAEYNKKFGEQIAEVADYAVLIGENHTKPIKEGLLSKGFDKDKIIVYNDVRDAYPFIGELAKDKEVYALFENDLPDTYNE